MSGVISNRTESEEHRIMSRYVPSFFIGAFALFLFSLNTLTLTPALFLIVFLKLIIPLKGIRNQFSRILIVIAMIWIDINSLILKISQRITWDVQGIDGLSTRESYLVISNHRSWADIFVLQHIFRHRIPFLKFFIKKELIWVPLLGVAWWALDFPFLKRYPRHVLEKHPELRGKDMEATRKACGKFKNHPVSVMNFVEGTRFDYHKHERQESPYRHLLMPRAGGIALVLSSMGDYLSHILDVTIVYPENEPPVRFWDLLAEKIPHITVRVRVLPIPDNVVGMNYGEDTAFREQIRQWINRVWRDKDDQIEAILLAYSASYEPK